MNKYPMPKELDFTHLDMCLEKYSHNLNDISIIQMNFRGTSDISRHLTGQKLRYKKDDVNGLYIIVNDISIHHFQLANYPEGFFMEYIHYDEDDRELIQTMKMLPDDNGFPKPTHSTLVNFWDNYRIDIGFKTYIPLEFHSWKNEEKGLRYWQIKQ